MATRTATRPIFRASLRSNQANGHSVFIPQCRKIVFEYCDKWPSSANTRTFLLNHLQSVAKENPHVEFVVKRRNNKEPIVRGFYSMCPITKLWRTPQLMFLCSVRVRPRNSQQQRQSRAPQRIRGQWNPEKGPASHGFIWGQDQTSQKADGREHSGICARHLEWSSCRPAL